MGCFLFVLLQFLFHVLLKCPSSSCALWAGGLRFGLTSVVVSSRVDTLEQHFRENNTLAIHVRKRKQKCPCSSLPAIPGPETALQISFGFFLHEDNHAHKIPVLDEGISEVCRIANFIFMGAGIFLISSFPKTPLKQPSSSLAVSRLFWEICVDLEEKQLCLHHQRTALKVAL